LAVGRATPAPSPMVSKRGTKFWYCLGFLFQVTPDFGEIDRVHPSTGCRPPPPPRLRVAKVGRNHLNEEITPPPLRGLGRGEVGVRVGFVVVVVGGGGVGFGVGFGVGVWVWGLGLGFGFGVGVWAGLGMGLGSEAVVGAGARASFDG
jgi:hypothetical protein